MQKVEEMSAYERERAEHIARNKERMAALHLPSLASSMAPKKEARPAKQRGISSKRHKAPVRTRPKQAEPVFFCNLVSIGLLYKATPMVASITDYKSC